MRHHPRSLAAALAVLAGAAALTAADVAVAPAPAGAHPARAEARTHVVRRGETASEIALRNGTTTAALAAANGIRDVDRILAGRRLRIPSRAEAASLRAAQRTSSASAGRVAASPRLPERLRSRPERLALRPSFARWAGAYGVPQDLLEATCWLESGWQTARTSHAGATGVCQLTPATSDFVADVLLRTPLDPRVPDDNIRMGARYLRWLLDRSGGDVEVALAGYVQGPASVARHGAGATARRYAADVAALRRRFR